MREHDPRQTANQRQSIPRDAPAQAHAGAQRPAAQSGPNTTAQHNQVSQPRSRGSTGYPGPFVPDGGQNGETADDQPAASLQGKPQSGVETPPGVVVEIVRGSHTVPGMDRLLTEGDRFELTPQQTRNYGMAGLFQTRLNVIEEESDYQALIAAGLAPPGPPQVQGSGARDLQLDQYQQPGGAYGSVTALRNRAISDRQKKQLQSVKPVETNVQGLYPNNRGPQTSPYTQGAQQQAEVAAQYDQGGRFEPQGQDLTHRPDTGAQQNPEAVTGMPSASRQGVPPAQEQAQAQEQDQPQMSQDPTPAEEGSEATPNGETADADVPADNGGESGNDNGATWDDIDDYDSAAAFVDRTPAGEVAIDVESLTDREAEGLLGEIEEAEETIKDGRKTVLDAVERRRDDLPE